MMRTRLLAESERFTAAERKVARALLANYPTAGLSTVSSLAEQAGVSDPTVLRFVSKLGFNGYPAFHAALLDEVDEQLNSPLTRIGTHPAPEGEAGLFARLTNDLAECVRQATAATPPDEFAMIVDLLADDRNEVVCVGGRYSGVLAERLAMHLAMIRPRVCHVEATTGRLADIAVDFGPRTVLVVFDYRRYQSDVVALARLASAARASTVLFTDRWRSPIAEVADRVVVAPVEWASPFDTKIAAIAQCEALVAALIERAPDKVRKRLERIEALREDTPTETLASPATLQGRGGADRLDPLRLAGAEDHSDADAVEHVNPEGRFPCLIACDHAGGHIPDDLDALGLGAEALGRHVTHDIGIADVARRLAGLLNAPAVLSRVSRLVVDTNRWLDDPRLILAESDGTAVPGNRNLSAAARQTRVERYFWPYHEAVSGALQGLMLRAGLPMFFALHSFAARVTDGPRHLHVGLFWHEDNRLAHALLEGLASEDALLVGDNDPFSGVDGSFSLDWHTWDTGIAGCGFEIRDDLLVDAEGRARWAERLAELLRVIAAERLPQWRAAETAVRLRKERRL